MAFRGSRFRRFVLLACVLCALTTPEATAQVAAPAAPASPASAAQVPATPRFANDVQAFLDADKRSPPPKEAILFVGSSIFRLWTTLREQMAPLPVFNRAFGGSRTDEILAYMDRIVLPYRPLIIVYYCGSNDVNARRSADEIAGNVKEFARRVEAALPRTTIYFVSVNRAPEKRARWDVVDAVNRAIREYATTAANLHYIDVNPVLSDERGEPRMEMYVADRLHLTPAAYEAFASVIKPVLEHAWAARAPR